MHTKTAEGFPGRSFYDAFFHDGPPPPEQCPPRARTYRRNGSGSLSYIVSIEGNITIPSLSGSDNSCTECLNGAFVIREFQLSMQTSKRSERDKKLICVSPHMHDNEHLNPLSDASRSGCLPHLHGFI